MSARHHIDNTQPALTVLQLDTSFPRIAGDVASPATYLKPISVLQVESASVKKIVTHTPDPDDVIGFERAVKDITSGIGVTSCGFMGYWQDRLDTQCPRPFLSSSLIDLPHWASQYDHQKMAIVTFDAAALHSPYYSQLLDGFGGQIIGLDPEMHLRKVIAEDLTELDQECATTELIALLKSCLDGDEIQALVLECTNLPPYKDAIKSHFDVKVFDILTSIAKRDANLVRPQFLS